MNIVLLILLLIINFPLLNKFNEMLKDLYNWQKGGSAAAAAAAAATT